MTTTRNTAEIRVEPNISRYQKAMRQMEQQQKRFSDQVKKTAQQATIAFAALTTATYRFLGAHKEHDLQERKLAASLKQLGYNVKDTLPYMKRIATELQRVSLHGDEASLKVLNMGVRLGQIQRDQMKPFIQTAADMAATIDNMSFETAGLMLGKVFADPIRNMTLLTRYGVIFTDAQKDMVKQLVETGRKAEAVDFIMGELNEKFKGAAASTRGGVQELEALSNNLGDLSEEIGRALYDYLEPFVDALNKMIIPLTESGSVFPRVIANAIAVAGAIAGTAVAVSGLTIAFRVLMSVTPVGRVVTGLAVAFVALSEAFREQKTVAQELAGKYDELATSMEGVGEEQRKLMQNDLVRLNQEQMALRLRKQELEAEKKKIDAMSPEQRDRLGLSGGLVDKELGQVRVDLADNLRRGKQIIDILNREAPSGEDSGKILGGGTGTEAELPTFGMHRKDHSAAGMDGWLDYKLRGDNRPNREGLQSFLEGNEEEGRAEEEAAAEEARIEAANERLRMKLAGFEEIEIEFHERKKELEAEWKENEANADAENYEIKRENLLLRNQQLLADMEAQKNAEIEIEEAKKKAILKSTYGMTKNLLSALSQRSGKAKGILKALSIAEATISAATNSSQAFADAVKTFGFPLGPKIGALQAGLIWATYGIEMATLRSARHGGIVEGAYAPRRDSVLTYTQPGEGIVPLKDMDSYKQSIIDQARSEGEFDESSRTTEVVHRLVLADGAEDFLRESLDRGDTLATGGIR